MYQRRAGAGSIVAYALGITNLDPLVHGLFFERFLNPERVSMPDIDIDFCERRRGEVIEYVTRKYGRENVAQIITFGTMKARAVVRDVGRALDIPYADVDKVAKQIPAALDMTLDKALAENPALRDLEAGDARVTRACALAAHLPAAQRSPLGCGLPEVSEAFFGAAEHHGIYAEPTFQSLLLRLLLRPEPTASSRP